MIEYVNESPAVMGKINEFTDLLMGTMAANIEIQIKTSGNTPVRHGNLRSSARSVKITENKYMVLDTAAYAGAQEAGHMTVHTQRVVPPPNGFFTLVPGVYEFRNHPRGGGANWFKKAIATVLSRAGEYIESSAQAVGLEVV